MRKKQRLPDKQEELLTKSVGRDVTDPEHLRVKETRQKEGKPSTRKPARRSWPPSSSSQQQHRLSFPRTMSLVCIQKNAQQGS